MVATLANLPNLSSWSLLAPLYCAHMFHLILMSPDSIVPVVITGWLVCCLLRNLLFCQTLAIVSVVLLSGISQSY